MCNRISNQNDQLFERYQAILKDNPEVQALRETLLNIGGNEIVTALPVDSYNPALSRVLLSRGLVMGGPVTLKEMEPCNCHENVARLWLANDHRLIGIGSGYRLSDDGLWREHSWGVRREGIIETTVPRVKYFGILWQEVNIPWMDDDWVASVLDETEGESRYAEAPVTNATAAHNNYTGWRGVLRT